MPGCRRRHCRLKLAAMILLALFALTSTASLAQDADPGYFGWLFGSDKKVSAYRADAINIAWKAELPAGLYDGDYSTCVPLAGSEKLTVDSAVGAHFNVPARITGAAVYVRRLSEEGEVSGKFSGKGLIWFPSFGSVSQLGPNTTARIALKSPKVTSDVVFTVTGVTGTDTNVCLTELEIYGALEDEEAASVRKTGIEGNWVVEYSDAGKKAGTGTTSGYGEKGNTIIGAFSVWPNEDTASTGVWSLSTCVTPNYNYACGDGSLAVSPEGKIHMQHGYGMLGHWGGVADVKQVSRDEIRGRWNYQERYGGAVVWRRVQPEVTKVSLYSQVTDKYDRARRPGRVEMTYDGYWWGPTSDMRGNRPTFSVQVYGRNLWGRHNVRIKPQSDSANVVDWDLELRGYSAIKEAGYGPPSDVVGLNIQFFVWAGAVPGRKTLYVDNIAIPFDFVVHGHPKENEVVWPGDATTPETLKELPPKIEFVSLGEDQRVLSDVPLGTPFRVRMTFDNARDEPGFPVLLRTRRSGVEVRAEVKGTDNPKVYLSEPVISHPSRKWDEEATNVPVSE